MAREREVVRLVTGGLSNREIGHQLFLRESTVKASISAALDRLDQRNRVNSQRLYGRPGDERQAARRP